MCIRDRTSADVIVSLNGAVVNTIPWTGSLELGESENVDLTLTNFLDGDNDISVTTANPNGEVDQVMGNDGRSSTFRFIVDGEFVTLNLLLDNFPGETTFMLLDEFGNTLFSGGPFNVAGQLVSETYCLDPGACFTFAIQDSYGDGICCGGTGNGNYEIVNAEGLILASSDGTFGSGEEMDFCATFMCTLTGEFLTSDETGFGGNGAILVTPGNGTGPFEVSIDGGVTFGSQTLFQGLSAGSFDVIIRDANGCTVEETLIINDCVFDVLAEVANVSGSGSDDGSVTIVVNGGTPPYIYSIDGGITFQDEPSFGNLGVGDFSVVIRDANGCQTNTSFTVDVMVNTTTTIVGQIIEVTPNPTDGIFRINLTGLERSSVFLPYQILSTEGLSLIHI